jgi:hypothetical protein
LQFGAKTALQLTKPIINPPNGSELNNIFLPIFSPSLALQSYSLQIFNRWGEIIFT